MNAKGDIMEGRRLASSGQGLRKSSSVMMTLELKPNDQELCKDLGEVFWAEGPLVQRSCGRTQLGCWTNLGKASGAKRCLREKGWTQGWTTESVLIMKSRQLKIQVILSLVS